LSVAVLVILLSISPKTNRFPYFLNEEKNNISQITLLSKSEFEQLDQGVTPALDRQQMFLFIIVSFYKSFHLFIMIY